MVFAKASFELDKFHKGMRIRDEKAIKEAAGQIDSSWRPKPPPSQLAHLWTWFCELNRARANDAPIPYQEIRAWAELTGRAPSPFDVETIHLLDATIMHERNKPESENLSDEPQSVAQIAETLRGLARSKNEAKFELQPLISPTHSGAKK